MMKTIRKAFNLSIALFTTFCFAQKNYYKVNGDKTVDENKYIQRKESTAKQGKLEELFLKTKKTEDSIIHFVTLRTISTLTSDGFDPYGETKKYIGTRFEIEKFLNKNKKKFDKNDLSRKPTFINFWFTRCPPCIEEIPALNGLKEKFEGKANFITITFNDEKAIEEFVKKQPFNFQHIANSKKQIDDLKISAYPTSLILDKNGIVKFVFGEVTYDMKDIEMIFEGLTES